MRLGGALLRAKANKKGARDSNRRCEASCTGIAMSEIPSDHVAARKPRRRAATATH